MMATWMDKRYINHENERRVNDCKNMDVVWTERNQFWVPNLFVNDVIEIVRPLLIKILLRLPLILPYLFAREDTWVSKINLEQQATDCCGMMYQKGCFTWPCFPMLVFIALWISTSILLTHNSAILSWMALKMLAIW